MNWSGLNRQCQQCFALPAFPAVPGQCGAGYRQTVEGAPPIEYRLNTA